MHEKLVLKNPRPLRIIVKQTGRLNDTNGRLYRDFDFQSLTTNAIVKN